MKLALLVVIAFVVLTAFAVAIWLSRDELDTLPRDVEDDTDWLRDFDQRDRW